MEVRLVCCETTSLQFVFMAGLKYAAAFIQPDLVLVKSDSN